MRYLIRRLLAGILVLFAVSTVIFLLVITSGDPTYAMAGEEGTKEDRERLREKYGLNDPLYVQYVRYVWKAVQGDLGYSMRYGRPVTEMILERITPTIQLVAFAIGVTVVVSFPLGMVSGLKEGSMWDLAASGLAAVGQASPTFLIGIVLILIVAVNLGWLPAGGSGKFRHLILPGTTLGLWQVAQATRMLRSSILEVMGEDYIRTARGKGLAESAIVFRHALKNAVIPVLTLLGIQTGQLLGGAVITEQVFAYPGLGLLGVQAILNRDVMLVAGWVIFMAAGIVVINLLVDMSYALLDPRIQRG